MSIAESSSSTSSILKGDSRPTFWEECQLTLFLALPLIAGQLSQMLIGLADTMMIGRLGVVELGAATVANTLMIVPIVLGFGFLSCVSVRVSQAHGARDESGAQNALLHGTWLAVALGVSFALLLIAGIPFLHVFQQPAEVIEKIPHFLIIGSISMIPAMLTITWKNHADALNRPWIPFWIVMSGVALNIVLNWVLIWGVWIFPEWGLEGAAVATLIARIYTAAALWIWLQRDSDLRKWVPTRWFARLNGKTTQHLLKIGFPASLQLLGEVSAFATMALLIGTLGTQPLAAHQIAINCAGTAFMIPLGIGMAMTVRVGEIVGADQRDRLHRVLLGGWTFSFLIMLCTMTLFLAKGDWIASQFVNLDAPENLEVVKIASKLLIVAGLFQIVDGQQVISAFALRGVNDVNLPAFLTFMAYWVLAIPLGSWLGFEWGLGHGALGLWSGLSIGLACVALALGIRAWCMLGVPRSPQAANALPSVKYPA